MATRKDKLTFIIFWIAWISVGVYVLVLGDILQKVLGVLCIGPVAVMGFMLYRYYIRRPSPASDR